jgi:hypothetical protein
VDLDDMFDVFDLDNDGPVCPDCAARCDVALPVRCDVSWCTCECRTLEQDEATRPNAGNTRVDAKTFNAQEVDKETAA